MAAARLVLVVQVAGPPADDDAELDLPVGLGRAARDPDVVVRADQGVGRLGEQDRLVRHGLAGLGGVVAVVQPDAQDLVRPGDRGADPLAGEARHLRRRRPARRPIGRSGRARRRRRTPRRSRRRRRRRRRRCRRRCRTTGFSAPGGADAHEVHVMLLLGSVARAGRPFGRRTRTSYGAPSPRRPTTRTAFERSGTWIPWTPVPDDPTGGPPSRDRLPHPRLAPVYRLEAMLGEPLELGDGPQGRRRIVPLTGGTFGGPALSGTLVLGRERRLADGSAGRHGARRPPLHAADRRRRAFLDVRARGVPAPTAAPRCWRGSRAATTSTPASTRSARRSRSRPPRPTSTG